MDPWNDFPHQQQHTNTDCSISTNKHFAFEDNFKPLVCDSLPDSKEYLAALEKKLAKLKSDPNVLKQLATKREACMRHLLTNDYELNIDLDTPIENSSILRAIAPERQALTQARSEVGLNDTKQLIVDNNDVYVKIVSLDLTKPDLTTCTNIIDSSMTISIEQALIIHNAGQIGPLTKAVNLTDIDAWRNYYDLNVFSVGILNAIFYDKLKEVSNFFVVNISSLCGRQPFDNMAVYGSAKAARDLYFRVFALEEPHVTVLNYSPGPVHTNMVEEICAKAQSQGLKDIFCDLMEKKTILTPLQTVTKLIRILTEGDFKSGDSIDYYDKP
ncbi:hypothetical protein FQR65_LT01732 [Abscondita terminalis]|nr:hypothetical protein FQR65_LT01732 [Abscondita terminalis]